MIQDRGIEITTGRYITHVKVQGNRALVLTVCHSLYVVDYSDPEPVIWCIQILDGLKRPRFTHGGY